MNIQHHRREIKKVLDEVYRTAKQEVFDDIDKWAIKFYGKNWYDDDALGDIKELRKIKKRHLSTSKKRELNSSFIQDCSKKSCIDNFHGRCAESKAHYKMCKKRSPK